MFKSGYTISDFEYWFSFVTEEYLIKSLSHPSYLMHAFVWSSAPLGTDTYWSVLQMEDSLSDADKENINVLITLYNRYKENRSLTWADLVVGYEVVQEEPTQQETELIFHRLFCYFDWERRLDIGALEQSLTSYHKIDVAMIWDDSPFPHNEDRNPYWRRYKNHEMNEDEKKIAQRYIRAMIFIYKKTNAGLSLDHIKEALKESEDEWNDYSGLYLNIDINKKPLGVFTKKSKATEEGKKSFLFWKTIELKMEDKDAA